MFSFFKKNLSHEGKAEKIYQACLRKREKDEINNKD